MGTQESTAISENDFNKNQMQKEFLLSMPSQNPNNAQPISNEIYTIPKNVKNFVLISSGSTTYVKNWSMDNIFVCGFATSNPPIPRNYYHLHKFKGSSLCTIHLGKREYQKAIYYMDHAKSYLPRADFLNLIIEFSKNNEDPSSDFNKSSNQKKPGILHASPTDPHVGEKSGNTSLQDIPEDESNSYNSNNAINRSIPVQQSDKLSTLSGDGPSEQDQLQEIQDADEESEKSVTVTIINSSQLTFSSQNSPQPGNKAAKNTKKPKKGKKNAKNSLKNPLNPDSQKKSSQPKSKSQSKKSSSKPNSNPQSNKSSPQPKSNQQSNQSSSQPKSNPQSNQLSSQLGQKPQNMQLSSEIEEEEYDESDNSDHIKKMQIDLTQTDSESIEEANSNQKSPNYAQQDSLDPNANNSSSNKNENPSSIENNRKNANNYPHENNRNIENVGHNSSRAKNGNSSSSENNENDSSPENIANSPIEGNSMSKMKQNRPAPLDFVIPKTGEELLVENDKPQPNRKLNTISPSRLPSNRNPSPNRCKLTLKFSALQESHPIKERELDLSFKEEEDDKDQFQFTPTNNEDKKDAESKSESINSEPKSESINSETGNKVQQETKPQLIICDAESVTKSCEKGPIYINREVIELEDGNKEEKIISTSIHFTTPNAEYTRQPVQLSEPLHYDYNDTEPVKKAPLVIAHKVIIDRYHKQRPIEICHMVEISKYTNEPTKKKQHQPKIIDKIAQLEDAACQRGIQAQLDSNVDFVIPSSEFMSSSHQRNSKHKSKQSQNEIPAEMVNYSSDLSQKEEQLMEHMEQQRIHKSSSNHSRGSRKHSHHHTDSGSTSGNFSETVKQNAGKKILDVHKKASQIAFDDSTSEKVMSTESYFDIDKKDIVPPSPKFISPSKKDRDTDVDNLFDNIEQSSEMFRPEKQEA